MKSQSSERVIAQELEQANGHKVGILTLNQPKAMNAVDLTMVELLETYLAAWHQDPAIKAVVLRGAGDKAFCAGGDIRQIYTSMTAKDEQQYQYADAFFTGEYRKDYRLSLFEKPLIGWGNGFVMGGGLGLYLSCNHKVGTETMKLGWPEIRIGLFPDCGGSWYLSRLAQPVGYWMGLSGSHFNALDAKALKLSHYCLEHSQYQALEAGLLALEFGNNIAENHAQVRALLQRLETPQVMPESELEQVQTELERFFKEPHLPAIEAEFKAYSGVHPWLKQGIENYFSGCPTTAHIVLRQIKEGARMSLKEVAQWDLDIAYRLVRQGEFAEGVRAIVVDKDNQPQWAFPNTAAVPRDYIEQLIRSPWRPDEHPLKEIEAW